MLIQRTHTGISPRGHILMAWFFISVSSVLTCNTAHVSYSDRNRKRKGGAKSGRRQDTQHLASRGPFVDPDEEDLTT